MTSTPAVVTLTARIPDAAAFAPFGRVVALDGGASPELVTTQGPDWSDAYTREPLTRELPHLGMTSAPSAPFVSTVMERHANAEEALLPAGEAIVLAVAVDTGADAPHVDDVRAFLIPPGTSVVLNRGVWHDACRGAAGPTSYYWLSSCQNAGSSPWTPITGGPVDVRVVA